MKFNFFNRGERRIVGAVFLVIFLLSGFLAGKSLSRYSGQDRGRASRYEVRQGSYRYTNPLLECETSGDIHGMLPFGPFKHKVEALIRQMEEAGKASFVSVYFRDLNNGPWFGVNENEKFYPASLLKVPVMMACLKQAEADPLFLQKKIHYAGGEDLNAPVIFKPSQPIKAGASYSVEELLRKMIVYSDNNTVRLLAPHIDAGILTHIFTDLGVELPIDAPEDYMSVKSYASFFRILFNSSYLSREMSEKALQYLLDSDFKAGIVDGIPPGVPVSHKFGEQTLRKDGTVHQLHDCGIVYYPGSPYLLCIMTRGERIDGLLEVMRETSRLVFGEIDDRFHGGQEDPFPPLLREELNP